MNRFKSCKTFFGNLINFEMQKISQSFFSRQRNCCPLLTVFISFLHMVFITIFPIDEKKFHSYLHPLLRVFTYTQIAS